MATIDELVVTLGLDASNFTDEQKKALEAFNKSQDAIDRRLRQLEDRNKKSAQSFGDATHAAEGLFSVLAGAGLAAFSRDIVNGAAGAGRMAANVGIATNELSAFGRMIERNGGNADAASGSLKGLADSMQRLKWGQASDEFKIGLSQVGGRDGDNPLDLFFKLAKFAESHTIQDVNLAAQRLGLSQEIANIAIKGGARALEEYRKAAAGALSPEQAKRLTEMQESWVKLDQVIRTAGNDVVSSFAPGFAAGANAVSDFAEKNRGLVAILGQVLTALTALTLLKPAAWVLKLLGLGGAATAVGGIPGAAAGLLGKGGGVGGAAIAAAVGMKADSHTGNNARTWLRKTLGIEDPGEDASWVVDQKARAAADSPAPGANNATPFAGGAKGANAGGPGLRASDKDREAWIRATAIREGINPDVAMRVARSEGFGSFQSSVINKAGKREESFGDFQLFMRGGLGNVFQKETGLDPRDPANERRMDEFALRWASKHGWGDFHGAANSNIGKWAGIQGGGSTTTIGTVVIQTKSDDPKEHAREFTSAVEKNNRGRDESSARSIAMQANSGQTQ